MQSNFKHLTMTDRITLEKLLSAEEKVSRIAEILKKHVSTIYREIKRGEYEHSRDNYYEIIKEKRYAAELAQGKYENHLKNKGGKLKIEGDIRQIYYIDSVLATGHYSPQSVLYMIKNKGLIFDSEIKSVNTIYGYIRKGIFPSVLMTFKLIKKKKHKKQKLKVIKKAPAGISIEKRPKEVNYREVFGHWEMDSVIGMKDGEKVILSFLERKTRNVILELAKNHSSNEVVKALNRIEKRFGSKFFTIFQTITCDNGTEFADTKGLQKALYRKGDRTTIYTCHPYCSFERGSNENVHRYIRRFYPKGTSFASLTRVKLKEIEEYINNYPRKLFNGKCSKVLFDKEMGELFFNSS